MGRLFRVDAGRAIAHPFQMKLALLLSAIALALGVGAAFFLRPAPAPDPEPPAVAFIRENLHDPSSFELVAYRERELEGGGTAATVEFRAKNGFGATRTSRMMLELGADGEVAGVLARE